jgi:LPXTG-site transpeptidase (sortase) family protein
MQSKKLNYWLVVLGVLVTLAGIVDAVGVVRATPAPTPPENFGPVGEVGTGFLPVQVPSESYMKSTAGDNPRLTEELSRELSALASGSAASLPTPTPTPPPEEPRRLWIPAIDLYAPVLPMEVEVVEIDGVEYDQWIAPDELAAGWHASSAPLGAAGNSVLNGHHNIHGEVFRDLVELEAGDEVILYSDRRAYRYQVEERLIFPERFAKPEQRVQNAELVLPSEDERLTLITCWPYESNTHRLVLIARPVAADE